MGSEPNPKEDLTSPSSNLSVLAESSTAPSQSPDVRPRKKTSTACAVCKKRKTKCSGEYPCDRCIQRGTVADCVIDSTTDLRRRGASEKRTEELESDRKLLDGILETIRSGSDDQVNALYTIIRTETDRSNLLSHVDAFVPTSEGSVPDSPHPSSQGERGRESQSSSAHRPRGSIHDLLNHEPRQEETR